MSGGTEETTLEPKDERGPWVWVTIGCGALLFLGLCLAPPAVYLWMTNEGGEVVTMPTPIEPPPSPVLPTPLPPPVPGSARRATAVVEEVSGSISGVRAGTSCTLDVTREDRPDGTFWCNAQITCGGQIVYGGGVGANRSGFFDCTLYESPQRHVVGEDASTSEGDGDPAMRLDTLRGTLNVRDDARSRFGVFTLRARVTGVS